MPGRESKWSWLSPERVLQAVGPVRKRSAHARGHVEEEENPWMTLQTKHAAQGNGQSKDLVGAGRADGNPGSTSRWLGDESTPYGFPDDDGTLKQIERTNWRKTMPGPRTQQFVPTGKSGTSRWQSNTGGPVRVARRTGSTWMFQSMCAVALVAVALYAHQSHTPVAQKVQGVFQDMFQQDYEKSALPSVENFLTAHHISLPAFGSIGAAHLHPPLDGTVHTDYSTTHPEMILTGKPGEVVSAVGSGTVRNVTKLSSGNMVTIDHGTIGTSVYVGLAEVSVKANEYLSAGQVIGKLGSDKSPQLHFSMEKNGHYIDPHSEIQFPTSGV